MKGMETADDFHVDDMESRGNRSVIMRKPFLFVGCLYVCVFVCVCDVFAMVSWSENVHLLDGHVYSMVLLHECLSASFT